MNLYTLEISPVETKYNLSKFRITLEGDNEMSKEGDWVGSNGASFYFDQLSGFWQTSYSNGNLNLYLFDGREKDRVEFSLKKRSITIHIDITQKVIATLDVNKKWLLNLGTNGTGYLPRIYKNYNFSYKVIERNF